jgi:hypothetical protein
MSHARDYSEPRRSEHLATIAAMKRPKHIRIYDNGGETFDRYTVVYMDEVERAGHVERTKGDSMTPAKDAWIDTTYTSLGMSDLPFHPQGICQHSAAMPGSHLGKRIKWEDLPLDCRKAVIQDLD